MNEKNRKKGKTGTANTINNQLCMFVINEKKNEYK